MARSGGGVGPEEHPLSLCRCQSLRPCPRCVGGLYPGAHPGDCGQHPEAEGKRSLRYTTVAVEGGSRRQTCPRAGCVASDTRALHTLWKARLSGHAHAAQPHMNHSMPLSLSRCDSMNMASAGWLPVPDMGSRGTLVSAQTLSDTKGAEINSVWEAGPDICSDDELVFSKVWGRLGWVQGWGGWAWARCWSCSYTGVCAGFAPWKVKSGGVGRGGLVGRRWGWGGTGQEQPTDTFKISCFIRMPKRAQCCYSEGLQVSSCLARVRGRSVPGGWLGRRQIWV